MAKARVGGRWIAAALLLTSCGCLTLPGRSSEPDTFLDTFKPEEAADPVGEALDPWWSKGDGTNAHGGYRAGQWNKSFEFSGVRQDQTVLAEALQKVRDDMLARVTASGAVVRGEVRLTCEKGLLRRFEFDYTHHGKDGTVTGEVRPCEHKPGWDLECITWEATHPRPWYQPRPPTPAGR